MGLDVYLRRCSNLADARRREDLAEQFADAQWAATGKEYGELTETEKDAIREVVSAKNVELGLDEYGSATDIEQIELDSVTDPAHMFKIGYLRSSYNSGGINSVLKRAGVMTLHDIFEPGDEYYVSPDWNAALERCEQAIQQYRDFLESPMGKFDAMRISSPLYDGVPDENAALSLFQKEYAKHQEQVAKMGADSWSSYSNREGEYFMKGVKVVAIIPNSGWGKGFYAVYEKESAGKVEDDWYFKALLITKETIAYVLSQPLDKQKEYFFGWSG